MGIEYQKDSMALDENWHREREEKKNGTKKSKSYSIQVISQNKSHYHITGSFPSLMKFLN